MRRRQIVCSLVLLCGLGGCRWFGHLAEEQQALLARGQQTAEAQEALLHNSPSDTARYAARLDDLLALDPTLTADPEVTFEFRVAGEDESAFALRTNDKWRILCDADLGCRVEEEQPR